MADDDERASTGIPGLDDILCGGLPAGRMYLVEGEPGVGKTTLAMQFLLAGIAAGESCLYIDLSETREELLAVARSHGWDVSRIEIHELSMAEQSALDDQNTLFDPAEVDLHETTRTVLAEVERLRPSRVVFDSVSELRLLAQDPLRYRRQILGLKEYFAGHGCSVLLLDNGRTGGTDLQLQTIVHGVVSLEHSVPDYGGDRRRLRVVKLRGVKFRGGYHDFKIEFGGLVVFPRLVAAEHETAFLQARMTSGNDQLDAIVGGGFDAGTSTLLIGPAGSGKSAIVTTCAVTAAARGDKPVLFMFDENRAVAFSRARSIGLPLAEHVEAGRAVARQIDPAELSPGEFTALVCAEVDRGARMVVIDSLNGYLTAMPQERFLVVHMHELLTYLAHRGVLTFLVLAQHGMIGTMDTPVDITYLADTVLSTRYFEVDGQVRKAIAVLKKRSGWHENSLRELVLTSEGIRVGEPLTDLHGVTTGVPHYNGGPRGSGAQR